MTKYYYRISELNKSFRIPIKTSNNDLSPQEVINLCLKQWFSKDKFSWGFTQFEYVFFIYDNDRLLYKIKGKVEMEPKYYFTELDIENG